VPARGLPRTADIVIVGAGVMGASIAFHLAQRKAGRVVVLDRSLAGQGASGRSSALIRMHYTFPAEVALAVKSFEIFRRWKEIVGEPGDFRKTGFVRIVPAQEVDRLKANVAMQRKLGVNATVIGPKELKAIEPDWIVDDIVAAAYEPDSGYGDGAGVANDFLTRAREMGVAYVSRTEAKSFLVQNGKVSGVATDKGNLEAPLVVAATGVWSVPLFKSVGFDVPLQIEYHEVAILNNAKGMKPGGCACIDSITGTYFRSEGHDKTLIGSFTGPRGFNPDDLPQRASQDSLGELIEAACKRLPALERAEVVRGITGLYDMTPDSRPMLGEIPGVADLHIVAGFSGMGFKISPAIGLVISELLLDGKAHSVDISSFHPGRFAEGKPIHAECEYADD